MTDKDETKEEDPFNVKIDFDSPWCSCCPSMITMPVATMIAIVLGVLVGWGMYEADVQDSWHGCYGSTTGSSSTAYSIESCANGEDGCVNGIKFVSNSSSSGPAKRSCWIEIFEYPGMLWIRALKCIVAPLIACMMLLIPSKLKALGKVGQKVAILLLFTSFMAAMEGLVWGNIFQPGKKITQSVAEGTKSKSVPNYVTEMEAFLNIGIKFVPLNIVNDMANLQVLGIITFFLSFGYYLEQDCPETWRAPILNSAKGFCRACLNVLMLIMWTMPVAMFSLLSYNTMKTDLESVAGATALYLGCQLVGQFIHLVCFYFTFFWVLTKRNPLPFFWAIAKAPFTALLTSSSFATLPVTLAVNKNERETEFAKRIAEFTIPLGATLNMDGTSLGFPIMVLFVNQMGEELYDMDAMSFGNMLLIAVLAMTCSLGTAPIPNAGLVYLTMLMEAADITDPKLQGLGMALIMLVDWIVDRVETAQNVTSDSFISGIIAYSEYGFFKEVKAGLAAEQAAENSGGSQMAEAPKEDGDQRV